jgi:hypothetical protein
MNKKEYLEMLMRSFGLEPVGIEPYRTNSCGGQYRVGIGWKGKGINKDGETVIDLYEPDGFNMAVYEILKKAKKDELDVVYLPNDI